MAGRSVALVLCAAAMAWAGDEAFNGRWIIAPLGENNGRALWLAISGAGTDAVTGAMVGGGPGGQLDVIRDAHIEDGQLHFHLEWRTGRDRSRLVKTPVTAALADGRIHGAALRPRGLLLWVGDWAPPLADRDDGSWREGQPVLLFDGTALDNWSTLRDAREGGWYAEDGVLKNRKGADLLVTQGEYWNFLLEAEYRVHPGMNGGIGLRGGYEIQILDDFGQPASDHGNGAVVEGFTAMATDWREDQPSPITLQGDHGAIEFRKIALTPLVQ